MRVNKKIKRAVITLLLIVGGLFLCNLLYMMLDNFFNGFVREWFDRNYIYHEYVELREWEAGYNTQSIRWSRVKDLVFRIFIVLVLIWVVTIRLVSVIYASWREKKVIQDAGRMIGDFMRHDREASEVFPEEYVEISLQMAQIKAGIQRQEQLQKEEAGRKNDLITYLAHDLKTPLTSVIGYLSLLEEARDMPDEQKAKYVQITLDKAMRLEKLINEFFEITRYNLQQIVLEKESVNLNFMLVQMTDEFYPILSAHGNTLRLKLGREKGKDSESVPAEDITVYADAEKLARVFNNILKNAIAYSYPDTEIRVSCRAVEDKAYIAFANKGKTIPVQKLDAVFEKFFRLDDARSTNNGGAGLGLAIVAQILSMQELDFGVKNRSDGVEFYFSIPSVS